MRFLLPLIAGSLLSACGGSDNASPPPMGAKESPASQPHGAGPALETEPLLSQPKLYLTGDDDASAAGRPPSEGDTSQAATTDGDITVVGPTLDVPTRDLSNAGTEAEPNDDRETASPLDATLAASGRLEGKEQDFFHFTAEGEPQLWLLEARGRNIQEIAHVSAGGKRSVGRTSPDDPALHTLANLFLLPGDQWIELRSREGSAAYTVRAVALGPPDPGMELEPNDQKVHAHELRFGAPRTGHLFEDRDTDWYRFNLNHEEHVALQLTPPPRLAATLQVEAAGGFQVKIDVPGEGGVLEYRALLPPGQYLVRVRAERGRSNDAYALRLDRLNPFLRPADLEPNNSQHQARLLPLDLVLRGNAAGRQDLDWYRLPQVPSPTALTVTPTRETLEGFRGSGTLRLYDADGQVLNPGLSWDREAAVYNAELPAATDLFLRLQGFGNYEYRFVFAYGPRPKTAAEATVAITLPPSPHRVAAFWHQGQRVELPLRLHNPGSESQEVELEATTSHHAWRPELATTRKTLAAGERAEVNLVVRVAPDAWGDEPVHVTVRASNASGGLQTTSARLIADCGAPPVGAEPFWPMPDGLLGGLNLAKTNLGSQPASGPRIDRLFDGSTSSQRGWYESLPATIDVELAGERPSMIAGVLLDPKSNGPPGQWAKDFTVSVSLDGSTFTEVADGSLHRQPQEQAFAFDSPVEAKTVRLTIHSSHQGFSDRVYLGEFKVIASPTARPFGPTSFNVAAPDRGGHLVWSDPVIQRPSSLLTDAADAPRQRIDGLRPFQWVLGFHHGRAAQIDTLEWVQPARAAGRIQPMRKVQVAVSLDGPTGPWQPLATWQLDSEMGSTSTLSLPEPVWARYLRFTHSEATERSTWHLPETLRAFERPAGANYRSILGEWGHASRAAIYERSAAPTESGGPQLVDDGNETRETARALTFDQAWSDQVELDRDVDWFKIQIPDGHNQLRLDLKGRPSLRAVASLLDASGAEVELSEVGHPPMLEASVTPGASYTVKIEEPPRSIVFAWDNSGSVAPYRRTIYQAISSFARGIRTGREFANLLPFQQGGGKLLLDDWTDQPHLLQRTINDYHQRDSSSNAESALIRATNALARRPGSKAILLLTDAASPGYNLTADLWARFSEVRPRVFTLELRGGGQVDRQQDLMQNWASVAGGHYATFSTHADLEVAFQRASCLLRRPAQYTLEASTRFAEPPGPGRLVVTVEQGATAPQYAIELILDASGSMLQRLGAKRRIDIARDVLLDLVTETLPPKVPLALRIFGHREAGSCRTDLEVPLAPLDPNRVAEAIRKAEAKNLAKTPIAESLRKVAQDLANAEGQRLVVLITDGEETCDGDPAAAVAELTDAGFDVRLNIVGFAIDDEGLKADFARWADLGGGRYFDADDEEALGASMDAALKPKFQVVDAAGSIVAEGTADGSPVELPAGTYTVKVLTSPMTVFEAVAVDWQEETQLTVDAP